MPVFAAGDSTWRALVGIDLSVKPGKHPVSIEAAPAPPTTFPLVVKARRFRTRTLKVDPAFVTPPPEAAERIERETRELNQIWQASAPSRLWEGAFVPPGATGPANSAFGTHSVFNGEPRSQHSGADFASPAGTPIKAPNAGRVVLASSRYFSGNTVVIDHGLGLFSLFAHLSVIGVKAGEAVKSGDEIGRGRRHRPRDRPAPALGRARERRAGSIQCRCCCRTVAESEGAEEPEERSFRSAQKPLGLTQKLSAQVPPGGMLWSSL